MEIIWTTSAYLDNLQNIEYLIDEWYLSVAIAYEEKVIETEELLKRDSNLGQLDTELGLHKILIVPQIYMFYEVRSDAIYIMRMWNNYQKPYW